LTVDGESRLVRYSNGATLNFDDDDGWYVNLPDQGERVVVSPQLRGDFVYLNSMTPSVDPCNAGGSGWLMAFGRDGKTPKNPAFLQFANPVVGYKIGLANQSTIVDNYRVTSDAQGNIDISEIPPPGSDAAG